MFINVCVDNTCEARTTGKLQTATPSACDTQVRVCVSSDQWSVCKNLLHNHGVIYKIIIFFFRRSKRQRKFQLFCFTRELNPYTPLAFSLRPPIHPYLRESSKWYFVNVERGNIADKLQPRNINVSFNNKSNVNIDVIIFTFYSDQLTIDVETGIVTK